MTEQQRSGRPGETSFSTDELEEAADLTAGGAVLVEEGKALLLELLEELVP